VSGFDPLSSNQQEALMKLAAIVIAAATLAGATAASAQSVEFRAGPSYERGYVDRDRDWREGRAQYRGRDDVVVIKKRRNYERYDRSDDRPRPGITIRERD
jgi:Ni/Co efflux regulator RcnB